MIEKDDPTAQMSERTKFFVFVERLDALFDQIWAISESKEAKAIADTFTKSALLVRKDLVNSTAKLPR